MAMAGATRLPGPWFSLTWKSSRTAVSSTGIWAGFGMVLFWGLIIALIFFAFRKWSGPEKTEHTDKAVDVLRQRYSNGEISTEEYKERLQQLNNTSNTH